MASAYLKGESDKEVNILCNIFSNLDKEIVLTVVRVCEFDLNKASTILTEMGGHRPSPGQNMAGHQRNDKKTSESYGEPSSGTYDNIIGFIKQGYKIVILMRGLPGSGKTLLATKLLHLSLGNVNKDEFIFSTDQYFFKSGRYIYDAHELEDAHQWNQKRCFSSMKRGVSPIIIDNTNLQTWEMKVYCVMAVKFGYMIDVAVPSTSWALNPKILAQKNEHGVEKQKIKEMLDRFQPNVTVKTLFDEFQLKYTGVMPQIRKYPPFPPPSPTLQHTPEANAPAHSDAWRAPHREYGLPEKKKPELPIEYVHRFEVKRETTSPNRFEVKRETTSPKKQQVTDTDQLLSMTSEPKSANTNANNLIDFINEHKPGPPQKEMPKISTDSEVLAKRLQENNELMVKMMAFLQQQEIMRGQQSTAACDTITTETKMEVDQPATAKNQTPIQNESNSGDKPSNLRHEREDLENENKMLWDMLNRTETPKPEKEKFELGVTNNLLTNIKGMKEDTPQLVTEPNSEREMHQLDRINMLFSNTNEMPTSFDFLDSIMSPPSEQNVKAPVKSEKSTVPKFDSKTWGLSESVTVSWDNSIMSPPSEQNVKAPVKSERSTVPKFDSKSWGLSESVAVSWDNSIMSPPSGKAVKPPLKSEKSTVPKFDSKAWGLSESATVSWDITSPSYTLPILDDIPIPVETVDQSTNTTEDDFKIARTVSHKESFITPLMDRECPAETPKKINNIGTRKRATLDKGCMTDEEELLLKLNCEESEQVKKLKEVFPAISLEDLLDVYEKCDKDFHWTVELVSNSPTHLPSASATENLKRKNESKNTEQPQKNKSVNFVLHDWNVASPGKAESTQEADEEVAKIKQLEEEAKQLKKQEEVLELKKQVEKAVTIGKEHYSDHVWQLKNAKTGAVPRQQNLAEPETKNESPELMAVNDDTVYISDGISDSDSDNDEVIEDMVELNLGSDLVQQLECMFGQLMPGENFKPVVQMPESLARQLHALYLESICRQIENQSEYICSQFKEDEEYAKRLQEEERESRSGNNMNEIMDEALALSIYQKDVDQWKNVTPDTLALKLTRQKLHAAFPQLEPKLLDEVLVAHDNNYKHTIEAVMNSMGTPPLRNSNNGNPMEPPISDSTLKEMKKQNDLVNKVTDETDSVVKSAGAYREEANAHMQKRRELMQLAQEQSQKRSPEVAMYYRHLAQIELRKAEIANQLATHHFIDENAEKVKKGDTLDLHFLFVKDAIVTLDIFLDYQISNLNSTNKPHEYYFVITGRGRRSEHGISKLKPAVIRRLKTRKIHFTSINPGMLRIKVQKNLPMSTDLEKPQGKTK